ncbi:hypothetical protein V8C35DRAFT_290690 [Trichoderma chlorosporum]
MPSLTVARRISAAWLAKRPAVPRSRSSLRPNNGALKRPGFVRCTDNTWKDVAQAEVMFFFSSLVPSWAMQKKRGKGKAQAKQRERKRKMEEREKKNEEAFVKIAGLVGGRRKANECKASRADDTTLIARRLTQVPHRELLSCTEVPLSIDASTSTPYSTVSRERSTGKRDGQTMRPICRAPGSQCLAGHCLIPRPGMDAVQAPALDCSMPRELRRQGVPKRAPYFILSYFTARLPPAASACSWYSDAQAKAPGARASNGAARL